MSGLLKKTLYLFLGIAALLVIAAIAFTLLFDANDFREDIAAEVQRATGRELVIEGDLELSLFPWLAINIGKTTLGNAPGFSDAPFVSFEQARLSVRLLPMLLRREVAVNTATLDALQLNLEVTRDGRHNWKDLLESDETADAGESGSAAFEIAGVRISDAAVNYSDAAAGENYRLTNFRLSTGSVARGKPLALKIDFDFELQPADLAGDFAIETEMMLDGEAGTVDFSRVEISVLGIEISADVEPFSYVEEATPTARIEVDAFSLKSLMERLDIEPPVTADPDALGKVYGDALVRVTDAAIMLSELDLVIDDTTYTGEVSKARDAPGTISMDLAADSINLGRYMEPADESAGGGGEAVPVEIPADLIRSLNVRGGLTVAEAWLSGMKFENVQLGLNAGNGRLRLHPVSAGLFNGKYEGDVQINVSGDVPALSVNENVNNVDLGALAKAMFDRESVTGSINGSFQLTGRGADLAAIQRSLSGNMSMELLDGAWEGTDVWYELRRARALFKKEPAPEPELPARTKFSNVKATGPVKDGVFRNDDLFAELPFMQLTGSGSVDLAAAKIDYRMTARILERPEFAQGASETELEEFTEAVIPLKITGPLADPSISPDIEKMLKQEAKKKIRERLTDKLLGGGDDAEGEGEGEAEAGTEAETTGEKKKKKDRDQLKDALKDLIGN